MLPKPNAEYVSSDDEPTQENQIRGILCNPIYTGIPPFPQVLNDETWIGAAKEQIKTEGLEHFLVNVLHLLRETYGQFEGWREGGTNDSYSGEPNGEA